ncbi:uncharacterized protein BJ212DRAFT_1448831 [Suillus subaureus]|uniref:CxC2-like cysteine cluster KDZ transposase-associated domain-containing protein n=1 Tax=Suillus subaureus TaxID=48587 RepID=A0A9P7E283_9AGAM|nr:uncharacterized protein BJ212DRAFT_1448831 [Suillus subaureus]KAG1809071.1 hypothetical protein BJ212DRAFT_1448831 [Suillus subaureus]
MHSTFLRMHSLHFTRSKVSAFEFYHCIACWSDNTGCGHDPAGVDATQEGELVVLCPACPHPGKNMAETLEDVSPGNQWIYSLFLAIDANFHLKCHLVSSNDRDPGLSQGWGYFVEERNYKAYLQENATLTQEKSTCVSHNAISMADTKASKGLVATGIGTVVCARHDMQLANGVRDLQKGEKYLNMDYIVFSTLSCFSSIPSINFSCNIALLTTLPLQPHPSSIQQYRFFVPKFHLAAHIAASQAVFLFNWSPHVGRTDREAPERGWADINHVAASMKEMAPGMCQDVLDDHFGDWNWKKVTGLGKS